MLLQYNLTSTEIANPILVLLLENNNLSKYDQRKAGTGQDKDFQAILNNLNLKMRAWHQFFSHSCSISGIQDNVCSVNQRVNVKFYIVKMKKKKKLQEKN